MIELAASAGVSPPSFLSSFTKALEPERAIVPRLFTMSSSLRPRPESAITSVLASLSKEMLISSGRSGSLMAMPEACRWRSFSRASEAFETSSRRKTSRSV